MVSRAGAGVTATALPPALLCAALALTLAFSTRRTASIAVGLAVAVAVAASLFDLPPEWPGRAATACWLSLVVTVAAMHWPRHVPTPLALGLAVNAGVWTGLAANGTAAVALALAALALTLPACWLAAHRGGIVLKVVASWLGAVAILAAALPLVSAPTTTSEHRE